MKDLLAMATVRRLLIELGYEVVPDAPGAVMGQLELWIVEPQDALGALSPLEVLDQPGGIERIRARLSMLLTGASSPGAF